jgi:histidinol dehydrogenase
MPGNQTGKDTGGELILENIVGFAAARVRLSRQPSVLAGEPSDKIKDKLKAIFGRAISPQEAVDRIIADVRSKGDEAIFDYTFKIDGFKLASLEVSRDQIRKAYRQVDKPLVEALKLAAERIRLFHQAQKDSMWHGVTGKDWEQLVRALARVGVYAPGGTASYPSTVLMVAVPPKVAGVKEVILVTPPRTEGGIPPATLVAADIAQVDRVFAVGGAQAIAALAYGTQSIPRVDKICGPGNLFVTLAKKAVFGAADIDALQGPSEVMIVADAAANPGYIAADLLAQAEHDTLAQVVLVTTSARLARAVEEELAAQLPLLSRSHIAGESLQKQGIIAVVKNLDQAVELANLFAPEHLELAIRNSASYLDRIINAGCVFLGENSTESLGDYVAGPNHSLPTGGTARFSSPLNILDYVKLINVVKLDAYGLKKLGPPAITIARAEGLDAHARAVEKRLEDLD